MITENEHGMVRILNYKGAQVTLVSSYYDPMPVENLWRILKYSKPDQILLQLRPDQMLENFRLNVKNPKTGQFSNRLYTQQLFRYGWEIMPNQSIKNSIKHQLRKKRVHVPNEPTSSSEQYMQSWKDAQGKNYKPFKSVEGLTDKIIGVAALYAEIYGKQVILGDLPEIITRKNLSHKYNRTQ